MTDAEFAAAFEDLFRSTYLRAVRRVRDKRDRLTPETVAFLDHLAMSGPLTPANWRAALIEARQVLDPKVPGRAVAALPVDERTAFLNSFHRFVSALKGPSHES